MEATATPILINWVIVRDYTDAADLAMAKLADGDWVAMRDLGDGRGWAVEWRSR